MMRLLFIILFALATTSTDAAAYQSGREPIDRLARVEAEDGLSGRVTFVFMMSWQLSLAVEKLEKPEDVATASAILGDEARTWRRSITPIIYQGLRERLATTFDHAALEAIANYYEQPEVAAARAASRKFRVAPESMTQAEVKLAFDRPPDPPFIAEYRKVVGHAALAALRHPTFCEHEVAFRERLKQRLGNEIFDAIAPKRSCAETVAKLSVQMPQVDNTAGGSERR